MDIFSNSNLLVSSIYEMKDKPLRELNKQVKHTTVPAIKTIGLLVGKPDPYDKLKDLKISSWWDIDLVKLFIDEDPSPRCWDFILSKA